MGKLWSGVRAFARFGAAVARHRVEFVAYISPARDGAALYRDTVIWLAAVLLGRRTIVHVHTGEYGYLRARGVLGAAQRWLLGHSELWAQTEPWRQEMEALGAGRSAVVSNGVKCGQDHDRARESPAPTGDEPRTLHVVFVGNIAIGKGIDVFLDVVEPLLAEGLITVTIAGAVVEPETQAPVDSLVTGFPDSARRLPVFDSITRCELHRSADVLLFPSRFNEAPSLVVCEAMEHGAVPIVSDRGALPSVVEGVGFVCIRPDEYGAVIRQLARDPDLLRTRSQACHDQWRRKFSLDSYSERVLHCLAAEEKSVTV
jgi:glycosyltransferase involved in cell wall biosynthesis